MCCIFIVVALHTVACSQSFYRIGSSTPVETEHLPGVLLAGGATDNNDAMRWMLRRADGGDVVVLRASGSDGYNNYMYSNLGVDLNSVTSIVIGSAAEAENEEVLRALRNAEVVFIAGGNQWNYVNHWRGTLLLDLLNELIKEKKITIGGTSAGMAVLGDVVFSAENNTIWSSEALENPYHWRMMLEKDFLVVPYLEQTVTDTHYNRQESDGMIRKGRHVGFMSRMVTDWQMHARGIGANEYTAIGVDENGKAMVFGHPSYEDYAYFLQVFGGPPEKCEDGHPLLWLRKEQALRVYKIKGDQEGSGWFDLADWLNGEGGAWEYWHVNQGSLSFQSIEEPSYWIRVSVSDENTGGVIEGALVEVEGEESAVVPLYGAVSMALNNPENLKLNVHAEGYFPHAQTLSVEGANAHVQVQLRVDDTSTFFGDGSKPDLTIYPNPVREQLIIRSDINDPVKLRILNLDGVPVYSQQVNFSEGVEHHWSLEVLRPGFYLLEATWLKGILIRPFVVVP